MAVRKQNIPALICETPFQVRFSEVDSMRIVWHGEYVRYFEDGREDFGRKFAGLGYMDIYESGYMTPIVDLQVQFKSPLRCNEKAVVETRFINCEAAKICFEYIIRRAGDQEIVATGSSIQVFLNASGTLELNNPDFFIKWKERWGVK